MLAKKDNQKFYSEKKYDLAGFCVGIVDDSKKVQRPKTNDLIVGIESSGIHSNGYSLVRKLIRKKKININKNKFLKIELINPIWTGEGSYITPPLFFLRHFFAD